MNWTAKDSMLYDASDPDTGTISVGPENVVYKTPDGRTSFGQMGCHQVPCKICNLSPFFVWDLLYGYLSVYLCVRTF